MSINVVRECETRGGKERSEAVRAGRAMVGTRRPYSFFVLCHGSKKVLLSNSSRGGREIRKGKRKESQHRHVEGAHLKLWTEFTPFTVATDVTLELLEGRILQCV